MIALIPSYEPTDKLVTVVEDLRSAAPWITILVVDDGSGPEYAARFAAAQSAGAQLIHYPNNRGKGYALKTGFRYVLAEHPGEDVVCADSDGQHRTADIVRVAEAMSASSEAMVLGGRRFTGRVPLRSKIGNAAARAAFRSNTGITIHDTQTGLRGFPAAILDWLLTIKGNRFEYELNMLLEASSTGHKISELPIETIYLDDNTSSHFRPIVDSLRVAAPFLTYAAISLASFAIDTAALQLMFTVTGGLLASVVIARVVSGLVNFALNRRFVFRAKERRSAGGDALRYLALALVLVAASYLVLDALTAAGIPLVPAKIMTDTGLYVVSFLAQRYLVFVRRRSTSSSPPEAHVADDQRGTIVG
jgi:glycosyltransferase involved in cell wall biosynthesis